MKIYYEQLSKKVKVLNKIVKIFLVFAILLGIVFALQFFKVIKVMSPYNNIIDIAWLICLVIVIITFIVKLVINKRKNVRFDGTIIKFAVNNDVEYEFDLRKVDELISYRSEPNITYGLHDSLAFRFHKNEIWTIISGDLVNLKTKHDSIELIRDINIAYANIKTQRAIAKMSSEQGIRFRYLSLGSGMHSMDDYNDTLKGLEATFDNYSNTYGEFSLDRLVITNDSLYFNKRAIASNKNGDYIKIKKIHGYNDSYLSSDFIEFYDRTNQMILSIDLTLVINAEFFKALCLSVFSKAK